MKLISFFQNKKIHLHNEWNIFLAISLLFFLIYCALSLLPHFYFQTNAYDLGIFNQALYHYSHFQLGPNTIRTVPILLGDHFELILFLLAPFYWIFGTSTLLIVQIVSIHFAALGIYLFIKKQTKTKHLALVAITIFYLFFGIYQSLAYDYHNNVLGVMFLPWIFYFLSEKKFKLYYLFFFLFLISKENLALMGFFLGLSIIFFEPRENRKHGYLTAGISVIYFILTIKVFIPYLNHGNYDHWSYQALGANPLEAIQNIIFHPLKTFFLLFNNSLKQQTWLIFLASGGVLTLLKPRYALLCIPVFAQKFFSSNPNYWGHWYQYSIEFAPLIPISAVLFLDQLKFQKMKQICIIGIISINLLLSFGMSFFDGTRLTRIFNPSYYKPPSEKYQLETAMKLIPENASVSTQNTLVPHLTNRMKILLFPAVEESQYILLNENNKNLWPLMNVTELKNQERMLLLNNPKYQKIFEENGVTLYERTDA